MRDCPDEETFVALADGTLSKEAAAALDAHVDGCAACRRLAASLARGISATSAPMQLGDFALLDLIGRGAMGEVYEAARLDGKQEHVALKRLPSLDAARLYQFKREFRALSEVSHPNLVALHELVCADGAWFITMELVRGVDFIEYVRDPRGVDEGRLRNVLAQLVEGLSALHAAGHVHRDVKPANVRITPSGRLVLLDFGLVAALAEGEHRVAGTPSYMAPEQRAGASPSIAADWFSVGVMLHEALTGLRPPPVDDVARSLSNAPVDLASLCSALLDEAPERRLVAARPLRGQPSFVGRAAEVRALDEAYEQVARGGSLVVALCGASGVGKSTLARHFVDRTRDALVFTARCYDRESVPHKALDPIVDEVVRWLAGLPTDERARLRPAFVADLARVFPVVRRVFDDEDHAADPHESRRRAGRALRTIVDALAARTPVILAIDDAQWSDEDSAPFVAELAGAPRVLMLVGHRPGDVPMLRQVDVRRIDVGALPDDAIRAIVKGIAGTDDHARETRIVDECGGNPLFATELARGEPAVKVSLDDAIRARVALLPDRAQDALAAVAVAGRPITTALVCEVSGASRDVVLRLRAERWVDARDSRLETTHDRVREAVRAALPPVRLAHFHRVLAFALEREGSADPEVLFDHFRGAGETTRAREYAVTAAQRAMSTLAFARAATLYGAALALAQGGPELHARLGDAFAAAGRGVEAARAYEEAGRTENDPEAARTHARHAAEQLLRSGHVDEGLDAIERAAEARLPSTPRRAAAKLALHRIELRVRLALPLGCSSGATPAELRRIDACWAIACTLGTVDTVRGAEVHCRALLLALRARDSMRIRRSLAAEAAFVATRGPVAAARAAALLDLANEASADDDPLLPGVLLGAAGMAAYLGARFREALDRFDAADRALARTQGGAWERETARLYALLSLTYLGDVTELRRRVVERLADAEARGDRYASTSMKTALTNLAWLAADRPEEARRMAEEGERTWSRRGFHLQHVWSLMSLSQIDLYESNGPSAARRIAERWPALERSLLTRILVVHVEVLHLRARASLASGDVRAARRDAARLSSLGAPHAAAIAQLVLAGADAHEGAIARAARRLEEAATRLHALDLHLLARAADRRRGEWLDDAILVARTDEWMTRASIESPARMTAMLVPA